MTEMEQWLNNMARRGAERMILVNDQPVRIIAHGATDVGPVIDGARLRRALQGIMPAAMGRLTSQGYFWFMHRTSAGLFTIIIEVSGEFLRVTALPGML